MNYDDIRLGVQLIVELIALLVLIAYGMKDFR